MPTKKYRKRKPKRWVSYFYLGVNTVTAAAMFAMIKPALSVISPTTFLFYRFLFALIFSAPIAWHYWRRYHRRWLKLFRTIIPHEFLGTIIPLFLTYEGLKQITALQANLLFSIQPILITIVSVWLLKEREESHELVGLLLASGATLVLVMLPALETGTTFFSNASVTGNLLIIASIVLVSFYYPLVKKAYKRIPKLLATTLSYYPGLLVFFLLALIEKNFSFGQLTSGLIADFSHLSVWVAVVYASLIGSIVAWTAYIKGQDGIEASEATLFSYLQPLVYIPVGFVVLGETISTSQALLLGLILTGVFIAEKRWKTGGIKNARR